MTDAAILIAEGLLAEHPDKFPVTMVLAEELTLDDINFIESYDFEVMQQPDILQPQHIILYHYKFCHALPF